MVNREYRRGLSKHPWGALVLRISVADVLLPNLITDNDETAYREEVRDLVVEA